jgi:hypothetical protein
MGDCSYKRERAAFKRKEGGEGRGVPWIKKINGYVILIWNSVKLLSDLVGLIGLLSHTH